MAGPRKRNDTKQAWYRARHPPRAHVPPPVKVGLRPQAKDAFAKGPLTTRELAGLLDVPLDQASQIVRGMRDGGLIENASPGSRPTRYRLKDKTE